MKKTIFVIIFSFITNSNKSYTGEVFINYSTGETDYKGIYEEGILISESYLNKDGSIKEPIDYELLEVRDEFHYRKDTNEIYSGPVFNIPVWYSNDYESMIVGEVTLKNGKFDGSYKRVAKTTGKLHSEKTYKNGKEHGVQKRWFPNGQLYYSIIYKDGIKHGPFKWYLSTGQLQSEGTWKDGKHEGFFKIYSKKGTLLINNFYVDGKIEKKSSSYSSPLPGSSSGSQKGVYDLRKGEISFRIVVREDRSVPGELFYNGFSSVYGVEGNVSGIIKNNTLYEDGAFRMGTIDRNGKWIKYDGHTIPRR